MLEKLKCQPFWLNISQTLKTCTEVEKMQKFLDSYTGLSWTTADEINERYDCLKPCTYIEYQVCMCLTQYGLPKHFCLD